MDEEKKFISRSFTEESQNFRTKKRSNFLGGGIGELHIQKIKNQNDLKNSQKQL